MAMMVVMMIWMTSLKQHLAKRRLMSVGADGLPLCARVDDVILTSDMTAAGSAKETAW
jgi:hypothetical protein